MASRVVYTAITNKHARLSKRPPAPDTDFICYSDVPLDRDDWKIRPIEAPSDLSPRMQAKFHKLFPPEGYEWNVWVDGSYILRQDTGMVDGLIAHSPNGLGLHQHGFRHCLFDEAAHSIELDKCRDQREIIAQQVRHYEEMGHPRGWGLWAGGLLCRNRSPRVAEVMKRWWDEMLRWSWRDQISLAYVFQILRFQPDTWPWQLFHNPYMAGWTMNALDEPLADLPPR